MAEKKTSLRKQKGKKEKVQAAVRIPSKRTMNFVHHRKVFNSRRMIPLILVIILAFLGFVKFGLLAPLAEKREAYQDLAVKQEQLISLQNMLKDYNEVEIQYGRYSDVWMSQSEIDLVSRMDMLNLVEKYIDPTAIIENLAANGNTLTLNIRGLTLEQASAMVEKLEEDPLVDSAYVYTATAPNAEEADMFLSINLTKEADER